MSGKSPLGSPRDPQAYEGVNILVPSTGAAFVKSKRNPPLPRAMPVPTIMVNTLTTQAFIQTANAVWQQFGTTIVDATLSANLAASSTVLADSASGLTFTLPVTALQGATITVLGKGTGGWTIAQNASQEIFSSTNHTTVGVTGTLAGAQYTSVTIMCVDTSGFLWQVIAKSDGTLTYT